MKKQEKGLVLGCAGASGGIQLEEEKICKAKKDEDF